MAMSWSVVVHMDQEVVSLETYQLDIVHSNPTARGTAGTLMFQHTVEILKGHKSRLFLDSALGEEGHDAHFPLVAMTRVYWGRPGRMEDDGPGGNPCDLWQLEAVGRREAAFHRVDDWLPYGHGPAQLGNCKRKITILYSHTSKAWIKWLPFCSWHFQMHFLNHPFHKKHFLQFNFKIPLKQTTSLGGQWVNLLWPSDAIWLHKIWINIDSGNGWLTYQVMITWTNVDSTVLRSLTQGQFHMKCSRSLIQMWKLLIQDYNHISQGSMS